MRRQIPLFDHRFTTSLVEEFRRSMRDLLFDLCRDLDTSRSTLVSRTRTPVGFFRFVGRSLSHDAFSGWKVVAWIEELNDLVYFLDVWSQLKKERRERGLERFAIALFEECGEQFYEHHYLDDLFPDGEADPDGLATRLSRLCQRLAHRVTQDSLLLLPDLPSRWVASSKRRRWTVPCTFSPDFERAELGGCLHLGQDGAYLIPPAALGRELVKARWQATLTFSPHRAMLCCGRICSEAPLEEPGASNLWRYVAPCVLQSPDVRGTKGDVPVNGEAGGLTIGPTLLYGKDRLPSRLMPTDPSLLARLQRALQVIHKAWPEGFRVLQALTSRIIPLQAPGVVSFSYRHQPGLSFLNTFDRNDLDLIDDLIHENSHHYLNLLLRKYRMQREGGSLEAFYSPWRRSLRPLRGILHATFTFTMGALLFERLSGIKPERTLGGEMGTCRSNRRSGRQSGGSDDRRKLLTRDEQLRARLRGLEEVASVRYSLHDLRRAAGRLKWLSPDGAALVRCLEREIGKADRELSAFRTQVGRSRFGSDLRKHLQELATASRVYQSTRQPAPARRKSAGSR